MQSFRTNFDKNIAERFANIIEGYNSNKINFNFKGDWPEYLDNIAIQYLYPENGKKVYSKVMYLDADNRNITHDIDFLKNEKNITWYISVHTVKKHNIPSYMKIHTMYWFKMDNNQMIQEDDIRSVVVLKPDTQFDYMYIDTYNEYYNSINVNMYFRN